MRRRRGRRQVHVGAYPPRFAKPSPVARVRKPLADRESRARDIERIVSSGVQAYNERREEQRLLAADGSGEVVRPIPRRRTSKGQAGPPPEAEVYKSEAFTAGILGTILRFCSWAWTFGGFFLLITLDRLLFRSTPQRGAERLLRAFQRAGGTAVKVGQQLAMRIDILPFEYCRELSKLLESQEPFAIEHAVAAIERATRLPLAETFSALDAKPIGSASIACVYLAVLKSGERVAVKVRRPGIGKIFARDLRAIKWLIGLAESLSIIRPGYLTDFISEFRYTIMEELDFRMEAYNQIVFDRQARKAHLRLPGFNFLSAPKVYLDYSNHEVIVQEFVSGLWMWEILSAVEQGNQDVLRRMYEMRIDPKVVATRLMYVQYWGQFVTPVYHADPHPANILVQEDGQLVFIDFGAVGSMSLQKRRYCMEWLEAQARMDVAGCVRAILSFIEPLPPLDTVRLAKELEIELGMVYRRQWSKRAEWYEKSMMAIIYTLFGILRRFDIAANLDTVRGFRANMLSDTLALRTYPDLDLLKVGKDFLEDYSKGIKKTIFRQLRKQATKGMLGAQYLAALQEVAQVGSRGLIYLSRFLERQPFTFIPTMNKTNFATIEVARLLRLSLGITLIAGCGIAVYDLYYNIQPQFWTIARQLVQSRSMQVVLGVGTLLSLRRILLRVADPEVG